MNKKKYQKPEMQVYPLMNSRPLLVGSNGSGSDEPAGYIPRMDQDMNQMA